MRKRHTDAAPWAGYRRWRSRCPRSGTSLTEFLATHREAFSSRSLGIAGDLMVLLAASGVPATRLAVPGRGAQPS